MANNPITTPLPADLPTNWTYGQTIGASGTDVGLAEQHGYNYLMKQVNAAQQAATQIGQAFSGLPSLGSDGKIPAAQLPAMNYDPAGSAAAVQQALASQIAALTEQLGGKLSSQTGTYIGTGETTNILNLPVTPKVLIITLGPSSDSSDPPQLPLVAICQGNYLTQVTVSTVSMSYVAVKEFGATVKITASYEYTAYNRNRETYTWVALY